MPAKPLIAVAVGGLMLLTVFLVLLGFFFRWRVQGSAAVTERGFPAPRLETSLATRAHAVETHGPSIPEPTAELDPKTRPAPLGSGAIPLAQAMAIVAAKGAHAYDPVVPAIAPAGPEGRR